MDLSSMQGWILIGGSILVAVAIAWAIVRNRSSDDDIARTEEATHQLYDEQDRDDKLRDEL